MELVINPAARWRRVARWRAVAPAVGVVLDASDMPLDDASYAALRPRLDAALAAMAALESGSLANPTEKRQVGHYWLRAPALAPTADQQGAIVRMQADVAAFAAAVREGRVVGERGGPFERTVVLGIGGSALGPQLVADALGSPGDRLAPLFADNTDPDGFDRVVTALGDLSRALVVVTSKSGGTKETRNAMLELRAAYEARGLAFGKHAVAVTGEGSELDRYAVANGFLARFPMWDWVGGRTSVTASVGLVPAALQGLDTAALLDGARAMDEATRSPSADANPAALLAAAWHVATEGRARRAMVVLPYKDRFALLGRYLQQLVMKSLGKARARDGREVHQGIAVYGNKGSTDQHAYVQQLREGPDDFFAAFVVVRGDREGASMNVEPGITSGDYLHGLYEGTRRALREAGHPSLSISVPRADARSLGALIALFERAVGLYAELVDVNAYDQPGVEAGKRAASEAIAVQGRVVAWLRASAGGTAADVAEGIGEPDVALVWSILEHLAANAGRGVTREGAPGALDARFRAT